MGRAFSRNEEVIGQAVCDLAFKSIVFFRSAFPGGDKPLPYTD
jgi:hypothetical protein